MDKANQVQNVDFHISFTVPKLWTLYLSHDPFMSLERGTRYNQNNQTVTDLPRSGKCGVVTKHIKDNNKEYSGELWDLPGPTGSSYYQSKEIIITKFTLQNNK